MINKKDASQTNDEDLLYNISLSMIPGIGPVLARSLLSYCGSAKEIFRQKKHLLERIPGIGRERAGVISGTNVFTNAEREIKFIRRNNIRLLFFTDRDYPSRLKNCEDAPVLIYFKGNAELNPRRIISIVGTRHITSYGQEFTERLIRDIAKFGVTLVSGLAYGVDIFAHKLAVKHDLPTIGVTAHGLDRVYPVLHAGTAEKMLTNGGIITEYPSGTKPDKMNFPARNRIVAGLCDATVVIESAMKGGALITADLANDYNRDVFALPGRVSDFFSRGCNELIRSNKAMLLESGDQLAEMMNWNEQAEKDLLKVPVQPGLFDELDDEESRIVRHLQGSGKLPLDELATGLNLSVSRLSAMLLKLEFAGLIKTLPGKVYELIR